MLELGKNYLKDVPRRNHREVFGLRVNITQEILPGQNEGIVFDYSGWTAYFFRLYAPILCKANTEDAVSTSDFKLYPPFKLDDSAARTSYWKNTSHPDEILIFDERSNPRVTSLPSIAQGDNLAHCSGIRIDCSPSVNARQVLDYSLSIIREYTRQWWLTTGRNPFDLGNDLICYTRANGRLPPIRPDPNRGSKVPWEPCYETHVALGIENPIDLGVWLQCGSAIKSKKFPETATQFLLDAITRYYENNDDLSLYLMCVCLEIMENKTRAMIGKPTKKYGIDLMQNATLWSSADREQLKRMFVDRGNIAHGRRAYHLRKNKAEIEEHLRLVIRYYFEFVDRHGGKWIELSNL